jgi:hypothetical protein
VLGFVGVYRVSLNKRTCLLYNETSSPSAVFYISLFIVLQRKPDLLKIYVILSIVELIVFSFVAIIVINKYEPEFRRSLDGVNVFLSVGKYLHISISSIVFLGGGELVFFIQLY